MSAHGLEWYGACGCSYAGHAARLGFWLDGISSLLPCNADGGFLTIVDDTYPNDIEYHLLRSNWGDGEFAYLPDAVLISPIVTVLKLKTPSAPMRSLLLLLEPVCVCSGVTARRYSDKELMLVEQCQEAR